MTIRFCGTAYHGFQVQKNALAVADAFQSVLRKVLKESPQIKGCSRTDTGVHANMFCISFQTEKQIPCDGLLWALNNNLPDDIGVISCREVPLDFHARYSCIGKRYLYQVYNAPFRDPFLDKRALLYQHPIDEKYLNEAAKYFLGTHDFATFCRADSTVEDTVRTIYDFHVTRQGPMVYFSVTGDGFLYNMVRILVGTLLAVSAGKIAPSEIPDIIASGNRERAGITVPPYGLYLDYVFYPPEDPRAGGEFSQEEMKL